MRIGNLLKSSLEPENKCQYLNCKSDIINCNQKSEIQNPKSEIEAEAYLSGTSQGPTPEDARLPARRAYSSERRTAISAVAAGDSLIIRARRIADEREHDLGDELNSR